jgi:hypothetical protein
MTSFHRGVVFLAIAGLACGDPAEPSYTPSGPCDAGLLLASEDPLHAARTMGMCDGLVSAAWVYPDGTPDSLGAGFHIGHGLLGSFGPNNVPSEGAVLLALSSGAARARNHVGYRDTLQKGYISGLPPGFPNGDPSCTTPNAVGYDGAALHVVLVVPAGVRTFAFDYAFFSRDYPDWVCTEFVDQAAALVTGITGFSGAQNVLLDASGNPMLASTTSMNACAPMTGYLCPLGTAALTGTGFESHGSTAWLRTSNLPVTAGDTLRITFMIWDTGDGYGDSSLLLDNFSWIP